MYNVNICINLRANVWMKIWYNGSKIYDQPPIHTQKYKFTCRVVQHLMSLDGIQVCSCLYVVHVYAKLYMCIHLCITYKCCFGWSAGYSQSFPETPPDMTPVLTFPEYCDIFPCLDPGHRSTGVRESNRRERSGLSDICGLYAARFYREVLPTKAAQ